MQAKGSPEQHKVMDPSQLLLIQQFVQSAWQELTRQNLDVETVPKPKQSLLRGEQHMIFMLHCASTTIRVMSITFHSFPCLSSQCSDIQAEGQLIHINITSQLLLLNAICAIECSWVVQLNGDGMFGFCRAAVDMIGLGFCSMGGANHPECRSYILHQSEGEIVCTVTFSNIQRAALALLPVTAIVVDDCEFTMCLKHLLAQPNVQKYMKSQDYTDGKLLIDQAQCDHQAGRHNFSMNVFEKPPNICFNHITSNHYQCWHCCCQHSARAIF
jgi:hypothetical protein